MANYVMKMKSFMTLDGVLKGEEDKISCEGTRNDIEIHFEPSNKKCYITIWSDNDEEDMTNHEISLKWNYKASSETASMLLFGADLIESCYKKGFEIEMI